MTRIKVLTTFLFFVCIFSKFATTQDIFVHYSTKDPKGRTIDTKVYAKNGDVRMELIIDMAGLKMTTASLVLKKNPDEMIILNPLTKSYTKRVKPKKKSNAKNYTIIVLGKEKIGIYNCTRVRIKSDEKSFDMWFTKDLPLFHSPIETSQSDVNKKLIGELENKGVSGMIVKTVYFNPGTTVAKLTMQLIKYESKPLSPLLFTVPADYKEIKGNPNKYINPQKKKEMMNQMMEQLKRKQ